MFCPADCPLTEREYEIAVLFSRGLSYEQIADFLGLTASTIRTHVQKANGKVRAHSVAHLVARMYASGWIHAGREKLEHAARERAERQLARTLARLQEAEERERERVSPAQELYLHAFERWLRNPDDQRCAMERALTLRAMFHEASWRSRDAGGPMILPPWELLGRPQPAGIRKRSRQMKVFAVRIEPKPDGR